MSYPEFTLVHLLLNATERDPDQTALVDGERRLTYGALCDLTRRLGGTLRHAGVRRGDRVGIFLEKSVEAVVSMLAVAQAGGVFVNINPLLKRDQVLHIVTDCGVRALIGESRKLQGLALPEMEVALYRGTEAPGISWSKRLWALAEAMKEEPAATMPPALETELAAIIYTSGSTGRPKGIMLSHHNLVVGAQIVSLYLQNSRDDRVLSVLPFSFDYGLNQLTTMLRVGGTLVLQRSLLPGDVLASLRRERVTGLAGVPAFWTLLLQNARSLEQSSLAHLRYITNSGGMIPSTHLKALRRLLPTTKVFLMYGLTEAFRSTCLPPEEIGRGPGCIGKAIPNTDIWVVNPDGKECAPGEVGELVHRGPTVAMGYWGDAERTRAVYRPNPFAPPELRECDVAVYSGDLVRRDEDGYLHYVGRRDELIKSEGYRVSPQEVEDVLCSLTGVREAVAFGQADPALGQRIVAVVSLWHGARLTEDALREQFSKKAPHYMTPRTIHIVDELPRTPTGKVDRSGLKHAYAESEGRAAAGAVGRV